MLIKLHARKGTQLVIALLGGICFGFLLQRGGVTRYEVFMGQLLLTDFTVFKIMLTAVITGMVGVHLLRSLGLAQLHPKPGSLGSSVIGGLIFGVGFAIVGYCPCTVAGAVAQAHGMPSSEGWWGCTWGPASWPRPIPAWPEES